MSFASNKTAHTIPQISRGRIVVNGGFKNGGFSMYGANPRNHSNASAWYTGIQDELREAHETSRREDEKYIKMQSDLDLRRAIRQKSGKLNDTEGMMVTQAKIDRYYSEKKRSAAVAKAKAKADRKQSLQLLGVAFLITLLLTGLWWVVLVVLLIKLTRRF